MSSASPVAVDLAPGGVLRASINLGNPVLAGGTADRPSGITVELAGELARRLGLGLELICFDAARHSFRAMTEGDADLCFLAVDPARETEVAFTEPYLEIEGVYAVPTDSALTAIEEVDRPGVRIGVKEGSAYDLYLTRALGHATVVRGEDGVTVFDDRGLEVGAGIRQPTTAYVAARPDRRLLDGAFMTIRQAVGIPVTRRPETLAWLDQTLDDLRRSGFLAAALRRAGQSGELVAGR